MTPPAAFNWVTSYQDKQGPGLRGLIPDVFDRYFLIPWTTGIMDHFPFDDYPATNWSIADLNKQHAIQRELGIFMKKDKAPLYREISLKELATRFGVAYGADTLSLLKSGPGVVTLPDLFLPKIEALLNRLSQGGELYQYADEVSRYVSDDELNVEEEFNVFDDVAAYMKFEEAECYWGGYSCLFNRTRQWCLCSLEFFPHLILCCNENVLQLIHEPAGLEFFQTSYDFPART